MTQLNLSKLTSKNQAAENKSEIEEKIEYLNTQIAKYTAEKKQ